MKHDILNRHTKPGTPCYPCAGSMLSFGSGQLKTEHRDSDFMEGLVLRIKELERKLDSFSFPNNPVLQRKFLTPKEAAGLLRVSYCTILEYIKAGELLALRTGKDYRIENVGLISFIEKRKKYAKLLGFVKHQIAS